MIHHLNQAIVTAKALFLSLILFPCVLSAQNGYWFKKGKDEKKPEKQVEYFTRSIEIEGAKAETYLYRGDAYDSLALVASYKFHLILFGHNDTHNARLMFERAKSDYSKAISLDPKCSYAYINRSDVHWQLGEIDQAVADLSSLIKIDSQNATAY